MGQQSAITAGIAIDGSGMPFVASGRYGEDRRFDWPSMALSVGLVVALLYAFVALDIVHVHKKHRSLSVVDLAIEPPPPPPPPAPQPDPAVVKVQPAIVTPPPIVPVSAPAPPPVASTPTPPPPQAVIVAPAAPAAPQPAAGPADAGDLSSKMISASPPRYPLESRRKREQGIVVLMVLLGEDGRVSEISVAQSSGVDLLDKAALSAVKGWRWSPTMRDGHGVMVRGLVKIPFVLKA
ncbi:TonB family protein [Sphingomonas naphthae]|uniref:Protein TonB n=1 Tax=Sphingomonas naphthae TaxID=1813468 RepID=A0ABY7TJC5_9SPHN|nr:energy transducer TonB [Sphingomonas naphthae]WCT73050.1 TonB family protein [Sphingomonas naphthae]